MEVRIVGLCSAALLLLREVCGFALIRSRSNPVIANYSARRELTFRITPEAVKRFIGAEEDFPFREHWRGKGVFLQIIHGDHFPVCARFDDSDFAAFTGY